MEESNEVDITLPPGFRFTPKVEELINLYLIPKNTDQPLPCNVIKEKPLYSDDPWKVLDMNNPHNKWDIADTNDEGYVSKMRIYIFTKLTKKKQAMVDEKKKKQVVVNDDDDAKQFVRKAGSGTWKSHTGKKEITNGEGKVIGFTRQLAFRNKKRVNPNNPSTSSGSSSPPPPPGRYTMHEFSVAGGESKFVLCEVTLWLKRMTSSVSNVKEEVDVVEDVTRDVGKRLRVDDGHNQLGGTGDVNYHVAASCSSEQYVGDIGGGYQGSEHEQFMMVGNNSSGLIPGQVNHITENGVEKPLQVIDHERFEQSPMALEAAVDDEDEYFRMMQKQLQQQHAMQSPGYNHAYDRETWNLLQECDLANVDWNH